MPIILGANPNENVENFTLVNPASVTISDALIFDRGLSAEEIKENYSEIPNPINKDQLLVWYKFN